MTRRHTFLIGSLIPAALLAVLLARLIADRPASSQAASQRELKAVASSSVAAALAPQGMPKAVVEDESFDLGVLNPGDMRRHEFVVRNEGTADLRLTLGSTSCKCTLANLDNLLIPPGEAKAVELEWRAELPQFRFRQGAVINTNDPALPNFELIGEGSVRVKMGTVPESAFVTSVPRNTERTVNVLLYSQAFTDATIQYVVSDSPAVSAQVVPSPASAAPPVETRFHRDLVITLAPQAKPGRYDASLRIEYEGTLPNGNSEEAEIKLPVTFEVAGDVTLHGRDVVGNALLFGSVSRSTGAVKRAYVHVRVEEGRALRLELAEVKPDWLQVRVEAAQRLTPKLLRFPVSVEIPVGAPLQALADSTAGEVVLSTTDADLPAIRLSVSSLIVP